ncbi:hypothetical protein, partial [Ancrocorticia sp.]|uniref:hypothetical protein n=1 Tax=Ancrocorticia sp. TaxID=2593684 RepID=UPI003F922F0A
MRSVAHQGDEDPSGNIAAVWSVTSALASAIGIVDRKTDDEPGESVQQVVEHGVSFFQGGRLAGRSGGALAGRLCASDWV